MAKRMAQNTNLVRWLLTTAIQPKIVLLQIFLPTKAIMESAASSVQDPKKHTVLCICLISDGAYSITC
jgi:hypothetical protein